MEDEDELSGIELDCPECGEPSPYEHFGDAGDGMAGCPACFATFPADELFS
jgi:uncharacterized protein (DUF983 family)